MLSSFWTTVILSFQKQILDDIETFVKLVSSKYVSGPLKGDQSRDPLLAGETF